jgi:predicted lipid-binding transport protein (Tim44 family)
MQQLIDQIARDTSLSTDKIEKGIAVFLGLIKTQGHGPSVEALMLAVPGAAEIADRHGDAGGGLMGKLAGGMMGGPLAAISKLQSIGLSTDQSKSIGTALIEHVRAKVGDDLLRKAAANIPGVSGYL